ncbi:hypothetical protein KCP70_21325 [Salmonella enterica subsp. enterica]|nr:hypothetical protein KCP70_21325 [Salmonella enterica subsp. enterica]
MNFPDSRCAKPGAYAGDNKAKGIRPTAINSNRFPSSLTSRSRQRASSSGKMPGSANATGHVLPLIADTVRLTL